MIGGRVAKTAPPDRDEQKGAAARPARPLRLPRRPATTMTRDGAGAPRRAPAAGGRTLRPRHRRGDAGEPDGHRWGRRRRVKRSTFSPTSMDGAAVDSARVLAGPLKAQVTLDSVFTLGGEITVVCTSTADKKCLDGGSELMLPVKAFERREPSMVGRPRPPGNPHPSVEPRHRRERRPRPLARQSASATGWS